MMGIGLRARDHWKPDSEPGSAVEFAVYPNESATLANNGVNHRKPESRAPTFWLGGKEGVENSGELFGGNAEAGIRDSELDELSSRRRGKLSTLGVFRRHRCGLNNELAAIGHGIARIDAEIQEYLLQLTGVGLYQTKIFLQRELQLDVFAEEFGQHPAGIFDHRIELHWLQAMYLLTAKQGHVLAYGQTPRADGSGPTRGARLPGFPVSSAAAGARCRAYAAQVPRTR